MKKALKKLAQKPAFHVREAHRLGISSSLVHYYSQRGLFERVCRGVYRAAKFSSQTDWQWEDLVVATKCVPQSVVCLVSALAVHGLTDETPRQHWLAVPHNTTSPCLPMAKIMRMRNTKLGKVKMKLGNEYIYIFNPERSIIDAFKYLNNEIAIKALKIALQKEDVKKINLKTLAAYSKKQRINIKPYIFSVTT